MTNQILHNMKRKLLTLVILLTANLFSQSKLPTEAQNIVKEGKLLYKSEMASWYGSDIFMANYRNRENIGGYFSYTEKEISKCVFFSKDQTPKALGTILFDNSFNVETAKVEISERPLTPFEAELAQLRKNAMQELISNKDDFFKFYEKMNPNLIPIISAGEKKVYILTGPKENGVIVFGNDYLLTFDKNNQLISKKILHKNIIAIEYGGKDTDKTSVGAMHTHLPETGDFITATDICTLMLYEKFAKWEFHKVSSQKYLNNWDCINDVLTLEEINDSSKKK